MKMGLNATSGCWTRNRKLILFWLSLVTLAPLTWFVVPAWQISPL